MARFGDSSCQPLHHIWHALLLCALVSEHVARAAPPLPAASPCWQDQYTHQSCCLASESAACWQEPYNYKQCCLQHPVLAPTERDTLVKVIAGDPLMRQSSALCGCERGKEYGAYRMRVDGNFGSFSWCVVRQASMLNWDYGETHYVPYLVSGALGTQCPLGSFLFMSAHLHREVRRGKRLQEQPSFIWMEEAMSVLFTRVTPDSDINVLKEWLASGWNPFLLLALVRTGILRNHPLVDDEPSCVATDVAEKFLNNVSLMVDGSDAALAAGGSKAVPVHEVVAFLSALQGSSCAEAGDEEQQRCCLPRALAHLVLADTAASSGRMDEYDIYLQSAFTYLQRANVGRRQGKKSLLSALLLSRWPVVDVMDRLFQSPIIELSAAEAVTRFLKRDPEGPLAGEQGKLITYKQFLFSRREIISVNIRFQRTPFCATRPFMSLIERIVVGEAADANLAKGPCRDTPNRRCSLDFIEGGPHLGDCSLWATAVMGAVGLDSFGVAFEPLPDASELFHQSVIVNGFDGRILVVPKGLAAQNDLELTLAFYPGRNGESTTVRSLDNTYCGEHCTGFEKIPSVTVDATWPGFRQGPIEMLKLSVNGAEVNTLRGSEKLLKRRMVCSFLAHLYKIKMGWTDPENATETRRPSSVQTMSDQELERLYPSSFELWRLLHVVGGLDIAVYRDGGDPALDSQSPQLRQTFSKSLNSVLDVHDALENIEIRQDYLIAHMPNPPPGSPCAGSLVLKHWDATFR